MHDLDVRKVKKNIKSLEDLEMQNLLKTELAHKFALMECCGWIEEKMHQIIFDYIDRKSNDPILRDSVKDSIKNMNYSLRYSDFREKLISALGEIRTQGIEGCIAAYDDTYFNFEHFKQFLTELKRQRDTCAHTYARTGAAPVLGFTQIKERLDYANRGLSIFQSFIRRR